MEQNQTLGRGEVHFALFKPNTTTPDGFRYLGNTPEFNLNMTTETKPHYSMDRGIKVKDKDVTVQADSNGSFTCDNINLDNLALFFLGSAATITQAAAAGETETLVDVKLGYSYQIGETDATPMGVRNITINTILVGATPLVADTDYTLDAVRGVITFLETATSVTDLDDVDIDYDIAATTYDRTISGNSQIEGAIMYLAYNPEGDDIDYRMAHVKISPNGDLALKGEDWMTTAFNVAILKPTGREAIYANGQPYTP